MNVIMKNEGDNNRMKGKAFSSTINDSCFAALGLPNDLSGS